MSDREEQNLALVEGGADVDAANASFYGRFRYPWPPASVQRLADPAWESDMLSQAVGDWDRRRIPAAARIWVAGCGTNQAALVALRFPHASVVGSDISAPSLAACEGLARELGVTNLDLRHESITDVRSREEFDLVVCTGVVHHTADPKAALDRIAAALRPSGVLELMVYNRFHRIATSAFQKAVRALAGDGPGDLELQLALARDILADGTLDLPAQRDRQLLDLPEAALADTYLQPVEHSYTVASLSELLEACGLELVAPCANRFDLAAGSAEWGIPFRAGRLRDAYARLPDRERWQVANLLLLDRSPMLWFYAQRRDGGRPARSETEVCEAFLERAFRAHRTEARVFVRDADGRYVERPRAVPYPRAHADEVCRRIVEHVAASVPASMAASLDALGIAADGPALNSLRLRLTTPAFPYLVSG